MPYKNVLVVLLFSLFFLVTGYFLGQIKPLRITNIPFKESRQQGNYQFINPLLECDQANFSQSASLDTLKNQISKTIDELKTKQQITFASVYYRDLNNGPWIGVNEEELFSPASLVKVPLMMTYYKMAESDPSFLQQKVTLEKDSKINQNILPSITLSPEKTYTYEELINQMIIYSDNQAYETLQNKIDNQQLVNTYNDLGVDISKAYSDPSGNIISVKSYAAFFRILFNASYLNKTFSEKALELLSQVKYSEALVKGINNPNIVVSHKFGERLYENTNEKQLHDCGIVYSPKRPYLICVMTRGNDFSKMSASIAKISSTIFNFPIN